MALKTVCLHNSAFSCPIWRTSASRPAYSLKSHSGFSSIDVYKKTVDFRNAKGS